MLGINIRSTSVRAILRPGGGGGGGGGPLSIPSSATHAAFISDMSFSGGNFTGFISDRVEGASVLSATISGTVPGDDVNGINHGPLNQSNAWFLAKSQLTRDASSHVVMFFEDAGAYTLGMGLSMNINDYIGAAQDGNGQNHYNVSTTSVLSLKGRGGDMVFNASRDVVWDNVFAPADTIKYFGIRAMLGPDDDWYPLQYPDPGGSFTPNVYFKGIIIFTDWSQVDDVIAYGLAALS